MNINIAFSPEDYKAIAREIIVQMRADVQAAAPTPVAAPVAAPAPSPVPAAVAAPAVAPAPVPAPAQNPAVSVPTMTSAITHVTEADRRFDDIVPEGTPGTIKLAKTGHVLSLPLIEQGEWWSGYIVRVYKQCRAFAPQGAMNFGDAAFAPYGGLKDDGSNWPIVADRCYNPDAYASDEVKAQQAAYNASIGWDGIPGHANDPFISTPASPGAQQVTQVPVQRSEHVKRADRVASEAAPAPAKPVTVFISE